MITNAKIPIPKGVIVPRIPPIIVPIAGLDLRVSSMSFVVGVWVGFSSFSTWLVIWGSSDCMDGEEDGDGSGACLF